MFLILILLKISEAEHTFKKFSDHGRKNDKLNFIKIKDFCLWKILRGWKDKSQISRNIFQLSDKVSYSRM